MRSITSRTDALPGLSGPDEGHELCMTIGRLARGAAAPGWSRLVVRRAQVGGHAVTTVTRDGHEIDVPGLDKPFERLRELSYTSNAGTWFTCELVFTAGSRGYTGRVDATARPLEEIPPSAALAELTLFPRREPPAWLLDAMPTAMPLALPRNGFDPWHREHRPRAPREGELRYVPAAAMTARALRKAERTDPPMILLTEHPHDDGAAVLMLRRRGDTCFLGRGTMFATKVDLSRVTLGDSTLHIELTPDDADALGTETVFDVHLEVPPQEIAVLRAVLSGTLPGT